MEPIAGIVYRNDVPPTLGMDDKGMVLTFFGHEKSPVHLLCSPSVIVDSIKKLDNGKEVSYPSFKLVVGVYRVTVLLTKPLFGHGTAVFKKSEFLSLLASA